MCYLGQSKLLINMGEKCPDDTIKSTPSWLGVFVLLPINSAQNDDSTQPGWEPHRAGWVWGRQTQLGVVKFPHTEEWTQVELLYPPVLSDSQCPAALSLL